MDRVVGGGIRVTPAVLVYTLCVLALGASVYLSRGNVLEARNNCEVILQTNKPVCGPFLDYWTGHGGADVQGFPISGQFDEVSVTDGQTRTVQYFEKAVFELHPEGVNGDRVQLAPLGRLSFEALYPNGVPVSLWDAALQGLPAPETAHNLEEPFLGYWLKSGGDAQFGTPLSKSFIEQIEGKPYKVQYFERAKLELHPEQGQTRYQVLPASLGTALFAQRYPQGEPTP
ncbi:MAG: hypothetical protein ABIQ44_03355 [Chloroflexia bacterium]